MAVTLENAKRGREGLPLGLYRQRGHIPGSCITPSHYHGDLEFFLMLEGSTTLVVEGDVIKTRPGYLYFINPNEVHAMHVAAAPSRYDCMVVPRQLLTLPAENAAMTELLTPLYEGRLRLPRQSRDSLLIEQFYRIADAYEQKSAAATVAHLLLFLDLCQQQKLLQAGMPVPATPVCRAIDFMQANFGQKLTLDAIASSAGMNAKYFCSYFKKHTHTTPITYLNALRIRHAKYLLHEGHMSVLEVALTCGFDNISFFIRQFKATTGKTPGQFRKSLLAEKVPSE